MIKQILKCFLLAIIIIFIITGLMKFEVAKELIELSKENNIIISNDVLNSMIDFFDSNYPNESLVSIFGNIDNGIVTIDSFERGDTINVSKTLVSSCAKIIVNIPKEKEKDFLGTIHIHTRKNVMDCYLSNTDKDSFKEDKIIGVVCNDKNYMILFYKNYRLVKKLK